MTMRAYVLMTAMPPTTGHLQLVQFANQLAENGVTIILSTQPHEPMWSQRYSAMKDAIGGMRNVEIFWHHEEVEQDPLAPGFWQRWKQILDYVGVQPSDYIVASEPYGKTVAELMGATFFPYDVDRSINPVKATKVRDSPILPRQFQEIIPEFQKYLRTTITIFGAESTGKTTLARYLGHDLYCTWLFEYARPYLENTSTDITIESMSAIWKGQAALQRHGKTIPGRPYLIQDTDLFSTVGYWDFPHWDIGRSPLGLRAEALALKSDLYLITPSNIPFVEDPIRYGGDKREGTDEYWIEVAEHYGLNYQVLESDNIEDRVEEACGHISDVAGPKCDQIYYDRGGL